MAAAMTPQAGDFCCVPIGGIGGRLIGLGERLCGSAFSQYEHAFVYIGDMTVAEAMPHGARTRTLVTYDIPGALWSTGRVLLGPGERQRVCKAALGYTTARGGRGIGYSWLDYVAIGAKRLRIPAPHLRSYIKSTGHMICSQLVDRCYQDAGVQLFDDQRWNGEVTPADLAGVIEAGLPPVVAEGDRHQR
jgi:hypothetical protein